MLQSRGKSLLPIRGSHFLVIVVKNSNLGIDYQGGQIFSFWHERSALQSVAVRRSTGNDVSGPLFSPLFSIPFSIFSPSRPFFIEGVLRSKSLFSESWRERRALFSKKEGTDE